MKKLSSKDAYELIKIAVAEGDEEKAIRIYVENRISRKQFMRAVDAGRDIMRRER